MAVKTARALGSVRASSHSVGCLALAQATTARASLGSGCTVQVETARTTFWRAASHDGCANPSSRVANPTHSIGWIGGLAWNMGPPCIPAGHSARGGRGRVMAMVSGLRRVYGWVLGVGVRFTSGFCENFGERIGKTGKLIPAVTAILVRPRQFGTVCALSVMISPMSPRL